MAIRVLSLLLACIFTLPVSAIAWGALHEFFVPTKEPLVETLNDARAAVSPSFRSKQSGFTLPELLIGIVFLCSAAVTCYLLYTLFYIIAKFW